MGSVFHANEEWLANYRAKMERISQNAQKRPSTASERKTGDVPGRRSPIRVAKPRTPNHTEEKFNTDVLLGRGVYEGVTFNCPGGKYTPDWVEFSPNGKMECFEIKGAHAFNSQGRASYAFKDCVSRYPLVGFYWAKLEKNHTWTIVDGRTGEVLMPAAR